MQRRMTRQKVSRDENCRFFFPNATYKVGDVFPYIHFKNFRRPSRCPSARPDAHSNRTRFRNLDGGEDQPPLRQTTAIALLAIGALAAAPWLLRSHWGRLLGRRRNGGVAPVCVPFVGMPGTPPITISTEAVEPVRPGYERLRAIVSCIL